MESSVSRYHGTQPSEGEQQFSETFKTSAGWIELGERAVGELADEDFLGKLNRIVVDRPQLAEQTGHHGLLVRCGGVLGGVEVFVDGAGEVAALDHPPHENTEPHFDLIEPGGMLGHIHKLDAMGRIAQECRPTRQRL